jgi:hypothetical protein
VPFSTDPPTKVSKLFSSPFGLLLLAICLIKLALYLVDPDVKVELGDSGSYIATALSGWVPPDRSYTYGLFLGILFHFWHSLKIIVIVQVVLSACAAMLLTWVLYRVLKVSAVLAGACGIGCALEPLQLLSERYILSEAISTLFFAIVICLALKYLNAPKVRYLLLIAIAGTALVSFRVYFLPAVLVTSVVLPVAANVKAVPWRELKEYIRARKLSISNFAADSTLLAINFSARLIGGRPHFSYSRETSLTGPWRRAARFVVHVVISVISIQFALFMLRGWYGYEIHGPAAYIEEDGVILLAAVSPIVHESDFRNRDLGHRVFSKIRMPQHEKLSRVWNMWAGGGMLDVLATEVSKTNPGDPWAINKLAKRTAIRSVLRHPSEFMGLVFNNLRDYLSIGELRHALITNEFVDVPIAPNYQQLFLQNFGWKITYQGRSGIVREWHQRSAYWCLYLAICPALATIALLIPRLPRKLDLVCCVLCAWPLWCVSTFLPLEVAPRYFTGLSWLLILVTGLIVQGLIELWRSPAKSPQRVSAHESAMAT